MSLLAAKRIELSDDQKDILKQFVTEPRTPEYLIKRSRIILMANEGQSNNEIERVLLISHGKAKKWRNRFAQYRTELLRVESETPHKLRETIAKILNDAQRRAATPEHGANRT